MDNHLGKAALPVRLRRLTDDGEPRRGFDVLGFALGAGVSTFIANIIYQPKGMKM